MIQAQRKEQAPSITQRERSKAARFEAITVAANSAFRARGYNKTSIQDIAEEAAVSPATVYNYFGTKIAILTELIEPDVAQVQQAARKVLADPPDDPCAGILALCQCYELSPEWRDRDLLMPFVEELFLSRDSSDNPLQVGIDSQAKDLASLIEWYKSLGRVDDRLNIEDLVVIITSLYQYHLKDFLYSDPPETPSDEDAAQMPALRRRIQSTLSGVLS